jgi:hypothetical protein
MLDPDQTERILYRTARDHACPKPRTLSYEDVGRGPEYTAFCSGTKERNGFYGNGIVNAYTAVLGN